MHFIYHCEICGSENYYEKNNLSKRLKIENSKYKVVCCSICNLASLYPLPNDIDLEWIYNKYAEEGGRMAVEKFRIINVYPNKIKFIKKLIGDEARILDVGAGIGGFLKVARDYGYNGLGIEMEKNQIEIAKDIYNINLLNYKVEDFIKINSDKYDVINLHHVLEHLKHPKEILISLKPLLRKNGILLIEIPNQFFKYPVEILIKLKLYKKHFQNPYHHNYFFSPRTFKNLLRSINYEIIYFEIHHDINKNIINRIFTPLFRIFGLGTSNVITAILK